MARLPALVARGRALPWLTYIQLARVALDRGRQGWSGLTRSEQETLRRLLNKSHGRPNRLSERERRELRQIVTKFAREAARSR